jgi:Na+:H+ antiporter, NhaA family
VARPGPTFIRPLVDFLHTEAAGGVVLVAATLAALVWANSPWDASYAALWDTRLVVGLGDHSLDLDLRTWVDDGLMALFFLVVGLEIKRELVEGELSDPRQAALPVVAAVGGMAVPALIYLAFNAGKDGAAGWGIPMATDIAFAVGLLAVLGQRVPANLRILLLTLAIADDLGAIIVIATVYSGGLNVGLFATAAALLGVMSILRRLHVRFMPAYVLLGAGVWLATYASGVSPTLAGVALGLLTPAAPFQRSRAVSDEAHRVADRTMDDPDPPDADAHHWLWLAGLSREAVSPLARLESLLHPWTSFVVVPVFALANAGVEIGAIAVDRPVAARVGVGIVAARIVGKMVGIAGAAWIAVRLGLVSLPRGVGWRHMVGLSAVAAVGFTVPLFVATLAYPDRGLVSAARIGLLVASVAAGLIGTAILATARKPGRSAQGQPL